MRLRQNERSPSITHFLLPLGAALGQREFAPPVPRIEDPSHPRGYPEIRSPAAMRILLKQKVQAQTVCCAICARQNGARQ
jgi:hypothetical protein